MTKSYQKFKVITKPTATSWLQPLCHKSMSISKAGKDNYLTSFRTYWIITLGHCNLSSIHELHKKSNTFRYWQKDL